MTSYLPGARPYSVIYQSAKLGDVLYLLKDFEMARRLDANGVPIGRLYGNSSGALAALAHGIVVSGRARPERFTPQALNALADFESFFRTATSRHIRRVNWCGLPYGLYNLDPLERWLAARLRAYTGLHDVSGLTFADLSISVYVCVQDKDGFPVFFGPPDVSLQAVYHSCSTRIENAPVLPACLAALCTMLSTDAYRVSSPHRAPGGHYYKDGRPAFADISAYVLDMEAGDPRPMIKSVPYTPLRPWRGNALTQPFIMHSWHERNQADLTAHYADLLARRRSLETQAQALLADLEDCGLGSLAQAHSTAWRDPDCPRVLHTDIPYLGSTEASTNMRQSVADKTRLMQQFREIGGPQLEGFDFSQPFNVIYGAGGFSGILAGLVMTRYVDERAGNVRRIFGCSAGVLNGLFHGVVVGARRHPELYTADALNGLQHLETFFEALEPKKLLRVNKTPRSLARAVANWGPLREQLCRYLERWTGRANGADVTFEDIQLPFYACGARGSDGYMDFFGAPDDLDMRFAGRAIRPINCRIVDAVVGGMAQPFYITPSIIHGETYFDGGGAFYDIGLFAAGMERQPISQLDMHFAEPPNHSYGFGERLNLVRIVFDTHNFTLPEDRRRMRAAVSLFYDFEALRRRVAHLVESVKQAGQQAILARHAVPDLASDWPRSWNLSEER